MLSIAGRLCLLALLALPTGATVLELVAANYTDYLSNLPQDANCVIEFYASWCPHCRHFMPTYDEVGSHFLDVPEPIVQVARIDCATEGATCRSMEVKTYPTVMYGKPPQFQAALHDGLEDSGLFVPHAENAHTAEVIIQHIQDYFNLTDTNPGDQVQQTGDQKSGDLPATQMQQEQLQAEQSPPQPKPIQTVPPVAIANGGMANGNQDADAIDEEDRIIEEEDDGSARADLRDIIAATVQTYREMCEADSDLWGQRDAFVAFWNLVRTSHPAQQCRWGAAGLIRKLKGWWPPEAGADWVPPPEMEALDICGGPSAGSMGRLPPGQYFSCRGSTPATRGYTCGLWMLLHSLAAGVPENKGPTRFMQGLRAFIENFFRCEECRSHFLEQLNQPEAAVLQTRDDAVVWLWQAHNRVNARIAGEEKREGTADPKFPKTQFPPEDLCVGCRGDDGSWDTAATLKFLLRFYGPHATDVRGASVTTQTQQVLTDSITNEEWKLQAPQRRARDAEGSGGRAPRTSEPQTSPEDVADAGRGAEDRPQLQVEEEGIVVGRRAGSPWWHKLLWLLGVWFVVSMFCRCRWDRRRRAPPPHRNSLAAVL